MSTQEPSPAVGSVAGNQSQSVFSQPHRVMRGSAAGACGGVVVAAIILAATWLNFGSPEPAVQPAALVLLALSLAGAAGGVFIGSGYGMNGATAARPPASMLLLWSAAAGGVGVVGIFSNGLPSTSGGAMFGAVFGALLGAIGGALSQVHARIGVALVRTALTTVLGAALGIVVGATLGAAEPLDQGPVRIITALLVGAAGGALGTWMACRRYPVLQLIAGNALGE